MDWVRFVSYCFLLVLDTRRIACRNPALVYVIACVVGAPSLYFIPELTPVLPIDTFTDVYEQKVEAGRVQLTSDYADMFGWEEQVYIVDSVYRALTDTERHNCVIWAENYGEAGALKVLGKKYHLPNPISRHGSFWMWGYANEHADVWISIGNEKASVESVFEETQLVKIITHKYAIGEENGIPLYVCRKPKVSISQWWQAYEKHIYD